MWDFSQTAMTFDNPLYLFDGEGPGSMPYLVGLEYPAAILELQQVGVLVPASIGYFGTYPISITWVQSSFPQGTVLAQSITAGASVLPNSPIVLTVAEFPMAVAFP